MLQCMMTYRRKGIKNRNMVTNSRHFFDVFNESREHYRVLDIKFIGDRTVLEIKSGDLPVG